MTRAIANKAIIITGASSGIGRATALALAREGAHLFLVARRQDRLSELETEIPKLGGKVFVQALDLRNPKAVEVMMESACARLGRIDVLINNAAFGYFGTVENTPLDFAHEIFDLNFHAPLLAIQLAIPIMRKHGSGHIINISSLAGKRGLPLSGIYCATKFALNGLSESLRIELKDSNILVSIIHPAGTKSEFGDAIRKVNVKANFKPVGHQQSSEEVASAIVRCIRNPRIEVYPYWPSRFVAWLNAIAPSLLDVVTARYLRDRLRSLKA